MPTNPPLSVLPWSMPSVFLPLLPGDPPTLCDGAEGLSVFLAPLNDPYLQARVGSERTVRHEGSLLVAEGERYRQRTGWVQGRRYLHLGPGGQAVAALNVTVRHDGRTREAVASNVFTAPEHRRQGLAAGLMAAALADFPGLMADNALSVAGAALVGHAPKNDERPSPRFKP